MNRKQRIEQTQVTWDNLQQALNDALTHAALLAEQLKGFKKELMGREDRVFRLRMTALCSSVNPTISLTFVYSTSLAPNNLSEVLSCIADTPLNGVAIDVLSCAQVCPLYAVVDDLKLAKRYVRGEITEEDWITNYPAVKAVAFDEFP